MSGEAKYVGCPKCAWIWHKRHLGLPAGDDDYCRTKGCKRGVVPIPTTPAEWDAYYAALPPAVCDECKCQIQRTTAVPTPMIWFTSAAGMFHVCPACYGKAAR
jgi:hypothetical protein